MDIKPPSGPNGSLLPRRQQRQAIGDFEHPRQLSQQPIETGSDKTQQELAGRQLPVNSPAPFVFDTTDMEDPTVDKTGPKKKRGLFRKRSATKTKIGKRKRLRLVVGSLLLIGLGYVGLKAYLTVQNIIERNSGGALALQDNIDPSQLSGEGDGRVNILLIGIGGDEHEGGSLADTIMVASIDPFNYDVAMLSVPRDLWVPIPGQWTTKINAAHALGEESEFSEEGYPAGGPGLLQKTLEEVLDIPIHYYIRVDFDGFIQAVDAVGSVDINVPETICDYNISWQFGFSCIEAGQQTFNSDEALFYARTRASARGDFDRGERQRLLILALRDKVLKVGTYSNPLKVLELMSAAGSHVKTNISSPGDIKRLYEIGEKIGPERIVSAGLDDYVTTGNVNGASAVLAKDADFSDIQKYVRFIFVDGFIKKESAVIDVLNGSGIPGVASAMLEELESYGYVIGIADDAPTSDYQVTALYDLSNGDAPFTMRLLEQRLGVKAQNSDDLPEGIVTTAKFVIIVGADAED